MRILLATNHLKALCGSEIATYTIATSLRRAGHDVTVFTRDFGLVSDRLKVEGIRVLGEEELAEAAKSEKFDVAHAHHVTTAPVIARLFPGLPIVYLSHGPTEPMERVPSGVPLAALCAVSEEVEGVLRSAGAQGEISVMRNCADLKRFTMWRPPSKRLERVLVLSNHFVGHRFNLVMSACAALGPMSAKLVGAEVGAVWETEREINEADLVVTIGRGVVEAMACARPVVVFDHFGLDGIVTPENVKELRAVNFSGRVRRHDPVVADLVEEFRKYDRDLGFFGREYALENADADKQAVEWTTIYEKAARR